MAWDGNEEEIMHREVTEEEAVDAATSPAATRTETDAEQSSVDETEVGDDPVLLGFPTAGGLMGRHRLSAAVSRLEQEILSLQKELEGVEAWKLPPSSAVCEQLAATVACVPDGLLPVTCGPEDVAWDTWFQRVHGGKGESSRSGGGGGGHGRGVGRRWWMQGRRFLPSSSGEGRRVEALAE